MFGFPLGLGSRAVVGGRPTPPATYLALINGDADAGLYNFRDATSPGGIFTATDQNSGADFVAPASFQSPGISATLGALYNATNKIIQRPLASGDYDIALTYVKDTGHAAAIMLDTAGIYDSASGIAAAPPTEVDGSSVATRQAFHAAIDTNTEHTIFFEGFTVSSTLTIGDTSFTPRGSIRRVAIYPSADRATHKAAAIAAVEAT